MRLTKPMRRNRSFPKLVARMAFWAASLFALVMALLPQPPQLPGAPSDKLLHVAAFLVLTALAVAAYPGRWRATAFGLVAFGGAIELLQAIPALHRDSQLSDWIADSLAVFAVLAVARLLLARR